MVQRYALQDQAYEYLFDNILKNKFKPGIMYSESQLTESINISRTPIRSALQRLQMEGYIDIYPSRGFMLHTITKEDLHEAFQTCIAQESYCVFCLAKNPERSSYVEKLNNCIARQVQNMEENDVHSYIDADRQFHGLIIESLHNKAFQLSFVIYRYKTRNFLMESLARPEAYAASIAEHRDIVRAIEEDDMTNIFALLRAHHNDFYVSENNFQ